MIQENMIAIKKALAKKLDLKTMEYNNDVLIVGSIPNGDYLLHLKGEPYCVTVEDNALHDMRKLK